MALLEESMALLEESIGEVRGRRGTWRSRWPSWRSRSARFGAVAGPGGVDVPPGGVDRRGSGPSRDLEESMFLLEESIGEVRGRRGTWRSRCSSWRSRLARFGAVAGPGGVDVPPGGVDWRGSGPSRDLEESMALLEESIGEVRGRRGTWRSRWPSWRSRLARFGAVAGPGGVDRRGSGPSRDLEESIGVVRGRRGTWRSRRAADHGEPIENRMGKLTRTTPASGRGKLSERNARRTQSTTAASARVPSDVAGPTAPLPSMMNVVTTLPVRIRLPAQAALVAEAEATEALPHDAHDHRLGQAPRHGRRAGAHADRPARRRDAIAQREAPDLGDIEDGHAAARRAAEPAVPRAEALARRIEAEREVRAEHLKGALLDPGHLRPGGCRHDEAEGRGASAEGDLAHEVLSPGLRVVDEERLLVCGLIGLARHTVPRPRGALVYFAVAMTLVVPVASTSSQYTLHASSANCEIPEAGWTTSSAGAPTDDSVAW